jgi:transcriptional regulator with XRE-family HTH domain
MGAMNWTQIIKDLLNQGFTQPQIAARVGCGQASISGLLLGKTTDPRYALGAAIKAMHAATVPRRPRKAPIPITSTPPSDQQ